MIMKDSSDSHPTNARQQGERGIDLGGVFKLRFEPGLLPFLEKKFKCWESEVNRPELMIRAGASSTAMTLVDTNRGYSSDSYQILRGGSTYQVSSEGIQCDGPIEEDFLEYKVLIPVINRMLAKRGHYIAYASGVVLDGKAILFPAISGVGKTSLLLEFMSRGASYLGNTSILVGGNGRCIMYSPYINFKERNVTMFPELEESLFEHDDEGRAMQKRFSFHHMALSMKGGNPASRIVRDNLISRFYFTYYADINRIFPDREKVTSAPVGQVFYLERRPGEPVVIESDPKELARIVAGSEWVNPDHGGGSHNILAGMAGLDFCAMEDYRRVFEDLFSHGECHRVRIPHTSSRALIKKIANDIERCID